MTSPRSLPISACSGTIRIVRTLFACAAVLGLNACDTSVATSETTVQVHFFRSALTAAPDSIYWTFSGSSGAVMAAPINAELTEYSFPAKVGKEVGTDTVFLKLQTLSITTYQLAALAGQDVQEIKIIETSLRPDSIANRLLVRYDSLRKLAPTKYPWTRLDVQAYYASVLLSGDARFSGYPENCPNGLEPKVLDSLILMSAVASKDSVGKTNQTWTLSWTPEQVKETYRRWLGKGVIRQGQYDTLYPFDDRPPTLVKPLIFTGGSESNAIQRGTDGVQLEGAFADDTGIVAQSLRILSKTGEDVTMKFAIVAKEFPTTPQKAWNLKGMVSIKADNAPTDLYTLEMVFKDRKEQSVTAKLAFSVYPLGGVAIDSIAPAIVVANPTKAIDTVPDTTKTYRVRFALSDLNLNVVRVDNDTVKPVDGVVEKTVALSEGKLSVVRIWANDSAGNWAKDSAQIFRKVAVLPKITPNHPASRRDTVPDTTYTYSFRWHVEGLDIDSIRIDTFGVLLDNQQVAEKTLPLKLGGTTRVRIRVIDKLHHVAFDSMDVVRGASVAPAVSRVGIPQGVVTVPDTQSYYTANWLVLDNNLQTLLVLGQAATLSNSKCGTTVFLKAGDTAKIAVWAQDKLGSIGTDTVKVWRPDPRAPYAADIYAAQRGEAAIALTDYVLPNVRFARFETTVGLYDKVMDLVSTETLGKPKTNVSIYDAMLFCNALSKKLGLDTFYVYSGRDAATGYFPDSLLSDTVVKLGVKSLRKGFRLPTDSEWLVAAGVAQGLYPWGSSTETKIVDQYALWNTTGTGLVGAHNPTGKGLFDLAGNASEWVYRKNGPPQKNVRWFFEGGDATSAVEGLMLPNPLEPIIGYTTSTQMGFRIVRVGSN